jgi:hypothetical protein
MGHDGHRPDERHAREILATVNDDADQPILIGDKTAPQASHQDGDATVSVLHRLHRLAAPEHDRNAELVVGIVAPLGTDYEAVVTALEEAFDAVRYTHEVVHVSDLLATAEHKPFDPVPESRGADGYYEKRMDAGDALRRAYRTGAALAAMSIIALRERREALNAAEDDPPQASDELQQEHLCDQCPYIPGDASDDAFALRSRHVTILRTLKHPDEVALLRSTYQSRFVLIGVTASIQDRQNGQEARLRDERSAFNADSNVAVDTTVLLQRDGKDPQDAYGQNVRDTFELADVFIATAVGSNDGSPDARRFVELIFGKPFITPRRDEA